MAPLCNVGLCFNPCAQQKIFCPGRLALIRPAVFSRSVFAGLSPHRLALSHGNGLRWPQRFHLSRSTEEANPPSVCHVASCALLPWGGFSSRRLLSKSLTPFPGGSPASPRFPLRRIRLTPFPQSCHGFVLAPSSRQKPRQPRVSANLCCGVVHSRAEPDENPSSDTRKGFLWAQLFRSPATAFPRRRAPFDGGFGNFRRCCVVAVPAPLPGARYAWHPDFALRRFHPSALQRSAIPPRRGQFPSLGTFSSNLWNSVRKFSNPWNMGPPLRGPPINWGPVRYAPLVIHCSSNTLKQFQPLLFPDIYREIETS